MSIESIRARLEYRCAQCPISEGDKLCGECPDADLRALLRVAEAAKARLEVWTEETYRELQEALAELEGMV